MSLSAHRNRVWSHQPANDHGGEWRVPPRIGKKEQRPDGYKTRGRHTGAQHVGLVDDINGTELSAERRARFVGSPAVRDLVHYPADVLRERGRHVYQAHGRLLLDDWAAECGMPGVTDLPPPADLRKALVKTGEAVRMLVAAAVAALPNEGDRKVLERRLGLSGDRPQTLEQIGTESGVTRERIRQRLDRAAKAITAGRARTGYRTVQAQAQRWLSEFFCGDDGIADESLILAVAELSFPRAHPGFVTRLITGIAGVHTDHQSLKPDADGSR